MAKKTSTTFLCDSCGETTLNWMGKCPTCGAWNTLKPFTEEIISASKTSRLIKSSNKSVITHIKKIENEHNIRISSKISELDRVLGSGGFVCGSVILIGGEPGIGKSTLLLQVASNVSLLDKNVLYFTGEESVEQIKIRADRLDINSNFYVASESNCDSIVNTLLEDKLDLVIVDSIQTVYSPSHSGSAGSVGQIRNCAWNLMQVAKDRNITIILVGHITKEGTIAGPKVLEHIVDCVLYFEGDGKGIYRIIRAIKNRYGAIDEVGVFEMQDKGLIEVTDASSIFTRSQSDAVFAGTIISPVVEGSRVFCVEEEALVSSSAFGYPRRLTMGYDQGRLIMIIAILENRARFSLANKDVYVNIAYGFTVEETASDLSIAMAIVSSQSGIPIQRDTTYIGELALSGEVRSVRFIEKRIKEMKKFGIKNIFIPKNAVKEISKIEDVNIIGIRHIDECVKGFLKN